MKTNIIYLEHANITVTNIDETIKFIQLCFPHFKIRGEGENTNGRKWIHIGNDDTYLAFNEAVEKENNVKKNYDSTGINHLGFVVNNIEEIGEKLINAGYQRSYPKQVQKFRIRDYFLDVDGMEYEFVQYLSEKPEEKNSYED